MHDTHATGRSRSSRACCVITRTHARSYGLEEGSTVWITPADGAAVIPRMAAVG
jgi:hypothetical protein